MIPLVIPYPEIDPILFQVGPLAIRWYSLSYIGGLLLAWWYMRALIRKASASKAPVPLSPEQVDDFVTWTVIGVVLGGRLGYVLFYKPAFFLDNPAQIFQVWEGGMSFHGGLLGVIAAGVLFARRHNIPKLAFADLGFAAAPIGLFLGRMANFINGELYGRVTDVPWAMVFPRGGPSPRHPSQLYEAALEGLALFVLLHLLWRLEGVRGRPGVLTGVFLAGYAIARGLVELVRQPDVYLGLLAGGTTMGQWLSAPMLALGLYLIFRPRRS